MGLFGRMMCRLMAPGKMTRAVTICEKEKFDDRGKGSQVIIPIGGVREHGVNVDVAVAPGNGAIVISYNVVLSALDIGVINSNRVGIP